MPKVENEHPTKNEAPIIDDKSPLTETLRGNLETLKLFEGLDHQAVEAMARSIEWIDLDEGQVLFRKGDAAEAMYVVHEGLLLASSTEEGCAPAVVGQMGPGSLVGEIALLTGGRRNATVTAAKKTRLARLDAREMTAIMTRHPEMKGAFLEIARQRLRRSQWLKILTDYFGEIDKDKYEFIESRFEWVHVNRGETLFSKGDAADGLYFLVHGFLHVVSQETSGEAKVLGAIFRGEIVGEMAILSGEKRTATVCAVRDSDLVRLTKADFEAINKAYPRVSLAIMRILVYRLKERDRTPRRVDRPPSAARPEVHYIPKVSYINEPENFFKTFLQPARFDTWQTPCCQQEWLNFLPRQAREGRVGDAGLD